MSSAKVGHFGPANTRHFRLQSLLRPNIDAFVNLPAPISFMLWGSHFTPTCYVAAVRPMHYVSRRSAQPQVPALKNEYLML